MILYNVTVNVESNAVEAWKKYMQETHIPEVLDTALFLGCRFTKLLVDEEQGETFAIQYQLKDKESLRLYQEMYAPALQQDHESRFKGQFVAFRSVLEVIQEF